MLPILGVVFYIAAVLCAGGAFAALTGYDRDAILFAIYAGGLITNLFFGAMCFAVESIAENIAFMRKNTPTLPENEGMTTKTVIETY